MSDTFVNHPFPYFGLKVTRDLGEIEKAIQAKYKAESQWKNRPGSDRWQNFGKYVLLIATQGVGQGNFPPDKTKVEAIVTTCLAMVENLFLSMVHPDAKTVHPGQLDRVIVWARDSLAIDEKLARQHLDEICKRDRIKVDKSAASFATVSAKPVTQLRAELREQGVRLCWSKPKECDFVVIRRSDWPAGRTAQCSGNFWDDDDEELIAGKKYEYEIASSYQGSAENGTNRLSVIPRGRIDDLRATTDGNRVQLQWTFPDNVKSATIYRSKQAFTVTCDPDGKEVFSNADLQSLGAKPEIGEYLDERVDRGGTYHYVVVAYHVGGLASPSRCVSVTLEKDPPPPEKETIRAEAVPGRIHLSWKPTGGGQTEYRIDRSDSANFEAESKHRRRWKSKVPMLEDKDVEPGVAYWYAISAERGGLSSSHPARYGPVLAVDEVRNLRVVPRSKEVELAWETPPGVVRVEVWRDDKTPTSIEKSGRREFSGTPVSVSNAGCAVDAGLTNGVAYYYRVSCVFRLPDGREHVTLGNCVKAVPASPPQMLTGLGIELRSASEKASPSSPQVVIRWKPLANVTPNVRRVRAGENRKVGDVIPLADLAGIGQALAHVSNSEAIDAQPTAAEPWYLVFSVNGQLAVYCGRVSRIEVTGVTARAEGENVILAWDWPPDCDAAEITHQSPHSIGPPTQQIVARGAASQGSAVFYRCATGLHKWHVRCAAPTRANIVVGPGALVQLNVGGATNLRWSFERGLWQRIMRRFLPWIPCRANTLLVTSNGHVPKIRLRLVGKAILMPDTILDGTILLDTEVEGVLGGGGEPLRLDVHPWPDNARGDVFCRMFVEPEGAIKVVPPAQVDDRGL